MEKYRPSNGTEGMIFIDSNCRNCIHGKYEHTGNTKDKPCDILTRSFCFDLKDNEYPAEWQYNSENQPTCTSFIKWDWDQDDDGNWNDPEPIEPEDPNQLCFPFILEEIEENIINQKQEVNYESR